MKNLRRREFRGSRLRCLLLTHQQEAAVADFLNALVGPHATVEASGIWMPRGFCEAEEAKLGESLPFLSGRDRAAITDWWLARPGRANTPNWDLVSQCRVGEKPGLILIEAKAHEGELGDDRCGATNKANAQRIKEALVEANERLNALLPGFNLSADTHYQLSNRFAFAWKVAQMGTPVVLIFLGFLDAHEMELPYRLLRSLEQWRECVLSKSKETVPAGAWDRTFDVQGTLLTVLIRSARIEIVAAAADGEIRR